jgi:hypothetical protein
MCSVLGHVVSHLALLYIYRAEDVLHGHQVTPVFPLLRRASAPFALILFVT